MLQYAIVVVILVMALVYAIRKAYIAVRRTNTLCDGCDGCPFKKESKSSGNSLQQLCQTKQQPICGDGMPPRRICDLKGNSADLKDIHCGDKNQ